MLPDPPDPPAPPAPPTPPPSSPQPIKPRVSTRERVIRMAKASAESMISRLESLTAGRDRAPSGRHPQRNPSRNPRAHGGTSQLDYRLGSHVPNHWDRRV